MKSVFNNLLVRGWSVFTAVVALVVGCSSLNIFPISEDKNLGLQLDKEIRQNSREYPLLGDAGANAYLQNIVNQIANSPEVKYRGTFPYKVEIIRDDKTINAFCTPGGYIYVYTGLVKVLDNEASIAGVLGHEIAHAECRHSTERMTKHYGASFLLGLLVDKTQSKTVEIGGQLFTGLALLKNSRSDESEADERSFKYLQSTKYYPGAIRYFFEKVRGERNGGAIERLLSTHPLPQDRLDDLNKMIAAAKLSPPNEGGLHTDSYVAFKRRLP